MTSLNDNPLACTVLVKNVYGRDLYYPHCWQSKLFAEIAGTDTLTLPTIKRMQSLGYTVSATRGTAELDPVQ